MAKKIKKKQPKYFDFYILISIFLTIFLVSALIYFKYQQNHYWSIILKAVTTGFMLVISCRNGYKNFGFYQRAICVGLVFALLGDVALELGNERAFLWGLEFFLMMHICYIFGFLRIAGSKTNFLDSLLMVGISAAVYKRLYPALAGLKLPVLVYIVVITFMVDRALAILNSQRVPRYTGLLIALGAVLFYVSDLIMAINKFICPLHFHYFSLIFYYAGQYLFAWSVVEMNHKMYSREF